VVKASSLRARARRGLSHLRALRHDVRRVTATRPELGGAHPLRRLAFAAGETSLWALALLRGGAAMRATVGSALGAHTLLRLAFHIDVWTDEIGGGLRLPHPFQIVIGEGVRIGSGCTVMHGVTIQRATGAPTEIGSGSVIGASAIVLEGARVGARSLIGAASVVRAGATPPGRVLVGAPARDARAVREGEVGT
jgi:serine acetyltransferase